MVYYIAISGKKRSGKDEFAKFTKRYIRDHILKIPFYDACFPMVGTIAFADPMKRFLSDSYGIPIEHFYDDKSYVTNVQWGDLCEKVSSGKLKHLFLDVRDLLQAFGEMVRSSWDYDFWAKILFINEKCFPRDRHIYTIITDVRYKNEAKYCMDHDAYMVKLIRDSVDNDDDEHPSENQDIPDEWFNAIIHVEEGMDNYRKQVFDFLEKNKKVIFKNVC